VSVGAVRYAWLFAVGGDSGVCVAGVTGGARVAGRVAAPGGAVLVGGADLDVVDGAVGEAADCAGPCSDSGGALDLAGQARRGGEPVRRWVRPVLELVAGDG